MQQVPSHHKARAPRVSTSANEDRELCSADCRNTGHFKMNCPKQKIKEWRKWNAQGWGYAVRNAEKRGNSLRKPSWQMSVTIRDPDINSTQSASQDIPKTAFRTRIANTIPALGTDDYMTLRIIQKLTPEREDPCQTLEDNATSLRAAPYEATVCRKCRSPQVAGQVGRRPTDCPKLIQENNGEDRPDPSKGCKRHRESIKELNVYSESKQSRWMFEVGEQKLCSKSHLRNEVVKTVRLELPQELSRVHHTFHVSNLKKCYADEPIVMPLEGIHVDDKLQFVEEPVEIMEREIKRLKRSRIPLVKVRWNSRRGPEFTWEREDSFKQKYPQLYHKTGGSSSSTTRS
ncbi:hypothetical protein Tco_0298531 [Tanacetum coccineum]